MVGPPLAFPNLPASRLGTACRGGRRLVRFRCWALEPEADAERVHELAVLERGVRFLGFVEEELVLGHREEEGRGVYEPLHAALGCGLERVGDRVAVDVPEVEAEERLEGLEVKVEVA